MRHLSCLILSIGLAFFTQGCAEDAKPQDLRETEIRVVSVTPSGGDISSNSVITVIFSQEIASPIIMLNNTQVAATTTDNKVFTFTSTEYGSVILTIETEDKAGRPLTGFKPIQFTVGPDD